MRILVALGFIAATTLQAGPISSGGGRAIVCYNSATEITSAKLLDLEEGAQLFADQILPDSTDMELALQTAVQRLEKTGYNLFGPEYRIMSALAYVRNHLRLVAGDVDLKMIDDSFEVLVPGNCKIKQVAIFNDSEQNIVINDAIWKALPPLHRAGLLLHETVYWMDRSLDVSDSKRARRVVAIALSQNWNFEPIGIGNPDHDYIHCDTGAANVKHTAFDVYKEGPNQVLAFLVLNGEPTISRMSFSSPVPFPYERPTDILQQVGANYILNSAYEGGSRLRIDRSPVFDSNGKAIDNILKFSVQKTSYPEWSLTDDPLSCWHMP